MKTPVGFFNVAEAVAKRMHLLLNTFYIALNVATFSYKVLQLVTNTQVGNCFDVLRNSEDIITMNQIFFMSHSCESFHNCLCYMYTSLYCIQSNNSILGIE